MLNSPSTRSRWILVVALLSVAMVTTALFDFLGSKLIEDDWRTGIADLTAQTSQIKNTRNMLLVCQSKIVESIATHSPETILLNISDIETGIARTGALLNTLTSAQLSPDQKLLVDKIVRDKERLVAEGIKPAVAALRDNNLILVRHLIATQIPALYGPVNEGIEKLLALQREMSVHDYDRLQSRYVLLRGLVIVMTVLCVALTLWMGVGMVRSVERKSIKQAGKAEIASDVTARNKMATIETSREIENLMMLQAKLEEEYGQAKLAIDKAMGKVSTNVMIAKIEEDNIHIRNTIRSWNRQQKENEPPRSNPKR